MPERFHERTCCAAPFRSSPAARELLVGPPHEGCRPARARPRHPQRVVGEDVVGPRFQGDGRGSVGLGEVGDLAAERLLRPGREEPQDDDLDAEPFAGGGHDVVRLGPPRQGEREGWQRAEHRAVVHEHEARPPSGIVHPPDGRRCRGVDDEVVVGTAWYPYGVYSEAVNAFSATRPGSWLVAHVAARVDPALFRWSRGRVTVTGVPTLPMLVLTTTGRRSGVPRAVQLAHVAEPGDRWLVVASAMGRHRHPDWLLNLRADPRATVLLPGRRRGRGGGRRAGAGRAGDPVARDRAPDPADAHLRAAHRA